MTEDAFDELVAGGRLLEWASMFGHRSGTPSEPLERELAAGRDAILEIDVQGAAQVRERVPDAVLVFLAPPSREELIRRLLARGTERGPDLDRRLAEVDHELAQQGRFDEVVVNDTVDRAVAELADILERHGHGRA